MNKICEFCGNEHDGIYGTGRFCSPTCARKFSNTFVSETGRQNQINALNNKDNRAKGKANRKNQTSTRTIKAQIKKQYRDDLRPKFSHTLTLGKIGELEVSKKFIEHGYKVYLPLVDDGDGIDLVVNNGNGFKTVQVKSSTESKIDEYGNCETTMFKICKNVRHIHGNSYSQIPCKYDPDKVNYIGLYSACDGESYLIENNIDTPMSVTIRNIYNNGQIKGTRNAEDYQIDKVLSEINLIPGVLYDNIVEC